MPLDIIRSMIVQGNLGVAIGLSEMSASENGARGRLGLVKKELEPGQADRPVWRAESARLVQVSLS